MSQWKISHSKDRHIAIKISEVARNLDIYVGHIGIFHFVLLLELEARNV